MSHPFWLGARGEYGPCAVRLLLFLNSAKFAHVTPRNAAGAACFRYHCDYFWFVITNFQPVITKTPPLSATEAMS
jgi:hypothetical protein